jgi:hypothetical protein
MKIFITLLLLTVQASAAVPLRDNILFAFERCKALSVDLEKGLLKEVPVTSFDLHCKKIDDKLDYQCTFFPTGSNKQSKQEQFTGGSELGVAELGNPLGSKIKFLIGKKYASYESGSEQKVCAGIFIFEQDALKQKASSPKSDL